ncbi:sulfur oxidation c-type cytochrome SoxX [Puniceibacterium confluentis]|uniref:sulfur oxidation c-type cytochrome SoxX n=1 Tax=Puniceibacterium confluentis TaxID=1958944 RepID=UPI0011B665FF|nr:sulfur oxidation c-type cytochrome SoxX [Puniceibacterium confluentis]
MRLTTLTLATTLAAGVAYANPVAPGDVTYTEDGAIEASLSGTGGDAEAGAKVASTRSMGNCVACHKISSLDAAFQGEVGPPLDGVADRWNEAELRGIVADAKKTYEGTMMPSFYKTTGFIRPGDGFTGKAPTGELEPLLSAQQIEDVVAFLTTLKAQ